MNENASNIINLHNKCSMTIYHNTLIVIALILIAFYFVNKGAERRYTIKLPPQQGQED